MTRYHLLPIGGVGVSALALVYLARGDEVSGCDLREGEVVDRLRRAGVRVEIGHDPEHVIGADVLVHGGGAHQAAAEVEAARSMGLTVLTRAEALAGLIAETDSIAIAGAAGKTTITHMVGQVLVAAGWDPTVLVGDGANARAGSSRWLVAEADESDRSLVLHHPRFALVSNIDFDHPDHFSGIEDTVGVFREFAAGLAPEAVAVLAADDERVLALETPARRVTYGRDPGADYRCEGGRPFRLFRRGELLGEVPLRVPGAHNVLNATGAVAVAMEAGVDFATAAHALGRFEGAHRRFERMGNWQGAEVYDDYAHHPAKVRAALAAARELPFRRVIAVFQPHRFTRYGALLGEFAGAFDDADVVLVTDVYGAGEPNPQGLTGADLAGRVRQARYTPDFDSVRDVLGGLAGPGDVVVLMGAGDIWKVGRDLVQG